MNSRAMTTLPAVQRIANPFDRFFNDFVNRSWDQGSEGLTNWRPAVDIYESDEGLHFLMDLPGMKKEDLQLTFENGVLSVHGERKGDWEQNGTGYRRTERFQGNFSRAFSLPQGVDLEKIEAKFEDGVLKVFVPKGEQLRAKHVEIR